MINQLESSGSVGETMVWLGGLMLTVFLVASDLQGQVKKRRSLDRSPHVTELEAHRLRHCVDKANKRGACGRLGKVISSMIMPPLLQVMV